MSKLVLVAIGGNALALDWSLKSSNAEYFLVGQATGSQVQGGPPSRTLADGTVLRRGDLGQLAHDYAQGAEMRGEFVIVIAPPQERPGLVGEDQVDELLRSALSTASLKDAVEAVTAASGQPRRLVYQRALALSKERGDGRD